MRKKKLKKSLTTSLSYKTQIILIILFVVYFFHIGQIYPASACFEGVMYDTDKWYKYIVRNKKDQIIALNRFYKDNKKYKRQDYQILKYNSKGKPKLIVTTKHFVMSKKNRNWVCRYADDEELKRYK